MRQQVIIEDLGFRSYKDTWDYQESLLKANTDRKMEARLAGQPDAAHTENRFLLVEHNPVYTLGKNGKDLHLLIPEEERLAKGIEYFHINRGGDITFHGPAQLVGYPIIDLEKFKPDLGWYMRSLEEVIIRVMADYGLKGDRSAGETGVWLDPHTKGKERKICALGIKCSRWITMHGFAFNVNTDLAYFNNIIPCGIQDKQVTSLEKELGYQVPMQEVKDKVLTYFAEVFDCNLVTESVGKATAG